MRILTVCGMGFGTSLMLLMTIKEIGKKYGVAIEGEAVDLGSYKGKPCDLIAASGEIARQIQTEVPILAIKNLLNKADIEEQLKPFLEKKDS